MADVGVVKASIQRRVVAVCAIGLALRLLVLALAWPHPDRTMAADSARYLLLARNLATFHTFGMTEEEGIPPRIIERIRAENGTLPPADANGLRPDSLRTPGYPAFIALIVAIARDQRIVLLVQCLLGAAAAAVVVALARRCGADERTSLIAGTVWAVHPGLISADAHFLTESLFNATGVFGVWLAASGRRPLAASAGGLLIGWAGLVRPLGLLFLPLAVVLAWPSARLRRITIPLIVVCALVPSILWAVRNERVGEGLRVSTVGEHTLFFYMAPYVIAQSRGQDWGEQWLPLAMELGERLRTRVRPGEDVNAAARRMGLEEIKTRAGAVPAVLGQSMLKLFVDHSASALATLVGLQYESTGFFSRAILRQGGGPREIEPASAGSVLVATAWMLANACIALMALFGTFAALRDRQWTALACAATVVLFVAATGAMGTERFRLPMMLPLLVLGAYAGTSRRVARVPVASTSS